MISATFRIDLPEDLWVAQLSNRFGRADFRLLSGYPSGETAVELGEVVTDDPDEVVAGMREHPAIETLERLESGDRRALTKYETTDTALYEFAELSGVTIEFPIRVHNGRYEFDLTDTREEFDRFRERLEASPLSYELVSVVGGRARDGLLTDRQREVLETARREGYYEVPRGCTLADVAETLGVDKSTVSTVLRRGEARVVASVLAGPEP